MRVDEDQGQATGGARFEPRSREKRATSAADATIGESDTGSIVIAGRKDSSLWANRQIRPQSEDGIQRQECPGQEEDEYEGELHNIGSDRQHSHCRIKL